MHDGGNGLDKKEYERVRATVCTIEWTTDDYVACFAMYILYIIVHLPLLGLRLYTEMNFYLILSMYPIYVFVVGYMSRGLFSKYPWVNPKVFATMIWHFPFLLYFTLCIIDAEFSFFCFGMSVLTPVELVKAFIEIWNEYAWKRYVAEHAKRRCYYHTDCLCDCDACRAPACACPAGADGACATKCAASSHPGLEKTGVDTRAYLANLRVCTFHWLTIHKIFWVTVLAPCYVSLLFYTLYAFNEMILYHAQAGILHALCSCVIQILANMALTLYDRTVRDDVRHYAFGYALFSASLFVWNMAAVLSSQPFLQAFDGDRLTVLVYAVVHLAGYLLLYACAYGGFFFYKDYAEKHYMRLNRRSECTVHPKCLCTCDRCGAPPAVAPAAARTTRSRRG